MKRILLIIATALLAATACSDVYEPAFGLDNLPEIIPAEGGTYYVDYDWQLCNTRAVDRFLEWDYRVLMCETVTDQVTVTRKKFDSNRIQVTIPRNLDSYPKPVIIEASVHYDNNAEEDWWSDWFPIASSVQLCY